MICILYLEDHRIRTIKIKILIIVRRFMWTTLELLEPCLSNDTWFVNHNCHIYSSFSVYVEPTSCHRTL